MTETPTDSWPIADTLPGGAPPPPVAPPPPPPDRRVGLGMLLAIAVIALAAAGVAIAYFLTHRDKGSSVTTVTSSRNTAPAATAKQMPKLVGEKLADAEPQLAALGVRASITPETSTKPSGTVLAQAPATGSKLTPGAAVTLVVAKARHSATTSGQSTTTAPQTTTGTTSTTAAAAPPQPQSATMPDVSSRTEAAAVQAMYGAGLLASLFFVPSNDPLGTVEQQAKPSGTTLSYHAHVQINVSRGPGQKPDEAVPNVVGQTLQQALAAINGAHLRLLYVKFPLTSRSQAGKIVQQSPLGGSHAPQNAQVVVFLGAYR